MKHLFAMTLSAVMLVSVASFADEAQDAKSTAEQTDKLNDAQIANVALTANKIDADRGKLAKSRATNPEVKSFAEQMIKDHQAGEKQVKDLAKKLKVKPQESALSKSLKQDASATHAKLKKLKGDAFDKAYIDAEVDYHQAVIDAANKVLAPNAQNPELKQALEATVPMLQDHLQHAKNVQSTLEKK